MPAKVRSKMSLNGKWRFNIDREESGEDLGWSQRGYIDEEWGEYPVPGNWDLYLPELFGYAGVGWFRRGFCVRAGWQGQRIHLRFDGANYAAQVWLNGEEVGKHEGGFDPFEFDITDRVDWVRENTLAVKVDNWPKINRVPNSLAGWWNYGGIYRGVSLLVLPEIRLTDIFIHPEDAVDGGPVKIDLTLINESGTSAAVQINGEVTFEGKIAGSLFPSQVETLVIGAHEQRKVSISAVIAEPHLWSPDSPDLYHLALTVKRGRKIVDRSETRFGIRSFEVSGTRLLLNHQPIFLTGLNRHEEYPLNGRLDPGGMMAEDMRWIQRMNGNIVRMHYQAEAGLYDLADEMGLLVFAEIPFWQVGVKDAKEWDSPEVARTAKRMLSTLIKELKNHPSVVIWSVGNECATFMAESRPLVKSLVELAHSLDASRPVAMVGLDTPKDVIFDLVDLPCMNTYSGHDQSGLRERIEKTHALTPEKPLLVTEFGAEAIYGLHGKNAGTEEEQASILRDHWEVIKEYSAFIPGAIIWSLADYWHMPMGPDFRWGVNRYYFCHGMLTLDRLPKLAAKTAAQLFGEKNQGLE